MDMVSTIMQMEPSIKVIGNSTNSMDMERSILKILQFSKDNFKKGKNLEKDFSYFQMDLSMKDNLKIIIFQARGTVITKYYF